MGQRAYTVALCIVLAVIVACVAVLVTLGLRHIL